MEEQVNSLKQSNENLQKHVEDLLNKLKEVRQLLKYIYNSITVRILGTY